MKYRNFSILIILAVLIVGVPAVDAMVYQDKIYPGVRVGPIEIGGESEQEARATLQDAFDAFRAKEASFVLDNVQTTLHLGNILEIDAEETLARAKTVGRAAGAFENLKVRIASRLDGASVEPVTAIHKETLLSLLTDTYRASQTLAQDAHFIFTFVGDGPPVVSIQAGKAGTAIDTAQAEEALALRAKLLEISVITLTTTQATPTITSADLEPLLPAVQELLGRPPLKVRGEGRVWNIDSPILAGWIKPARKDNETTLKFDTAKIIGWLDEIAPSIEQNPVDALFELGPDQKKVVKFKAGQSGVQIPRDQNAEKIAAALAEGVREIELIRAEIPPQISTAHGAELYGIKELLGRATTNFKGSPRNRVKNIARGAEILYGTLIAPDEEFSLLERLRPFTLENGYLSELVIKAAEGRTVPEIGGGLCQIGTTMFRVVLDAGLPIVARRNHSYRVSYYEPPIGMDATIYDPAPDFKFKNDTGSWLLLTTHVDTKQMTVTFELWGTDDGRKAETSAPEVFNYRQPPEAKIIETAELPPGVKRCTERAHVGSDARFTYKVTYVDGTVREEEFESRYRPWQEVCLLGVEPKAGEAVDTAQGEALPSTLPSADALGVVGNE